MQIIAIGNFKNRALKQAFDEYVFRIKRYIPFNEIALKDSNFKEPEKILSDEAEKINAYIRNKSFFKVALSEEGKKFSSKKFAEFLEKKFNESKKVCFIIGGAEGLHDSVKKNSNLLLSLSSLTFPHELARLILAEQVFRALKIMKGEPYHR